MVSLGCVCVCALVVLCTTCFTVVFGCGLLTMHLGNFHFCALMFFCCLDLCVSQNVGLDYCTCEDVSVCSLPVLMLISLCVLVWFGAATVISGLLRHSSSPVPDQFSSCCQLSVWQIAWRGTAQLSSTQLGSAQMAKATSHNNNFDSAELFYPFVLRSYSFLQLLGYSIEV